jgi:phosphate starvation-inducible protein PhoH
MSRKPRTSKKNLEFPTIDSSFNLKKISPLTEAQKDVFDAFEEGYNLLLCGSAGTGKTYISLYLALSRIIRSKDLDDPHKIMIIRSTVSTRDVGFLPGTLKEKMSVYEDPYKGVFSELFGRGDAFEILKSKGFVEFCSTSYLRGTTINNTFIILDEIQNCNYEEIKTVITRVGKNTKLIMCGDTKQNDLYRSKYDVSGLEEMINIISEMKEFEIIDFNIDDIIRSNIVKSFIISEENYLKNKKQ